MTQDQAEMETLLRAIIERFRHAASWIASDSWDWCSECRSKLEAAASFANYHLGYLTPDAVGKLSAKILGADHTAWKELAALRQQLAEAEEKGRQAGLEMAATLARAVGYDRLAAGIMKMGESERLSAPKEG